MGLSSVSSQTIRKLMAITATIVSTIISLEANQSSSLPRSSITCRLPIPITNSASQRRQSAAVRYGFRGAQGLQRHHHDRNADRHVDEEDPAPVVVIADIAAENRATNRRDDHRHRPQRQRDRAFGRRIVAEQQDFATAGSADRRRSLNHAEENQHRQAVGHPAGPGGDGERHRRPQEQLHFPDAFCQPAGDRN